MNSFWNSLYDQYKDRRYAALFLVILVASTGVVILGIILYLRANALDREEDVVALLAGAGLFTAALIWRAIRWLRVPRRRPPTFSPLSRDELIKARSKLVKDRTFRKL